MLKCKYCGEESPMDAKFCIGCAKAIEIPAYSGKTVDLGRIRQSIQPTSGAPYNNPFIAYSGYQEYGTGFQQGHFATITGAIAFPFVDFSRTAQEDGEYFIYRADLRAILQNPNTFVTKTSEGYYIYYYGRKVVFID